MNDTSSSGTSPNKRQRKDTVTTAKKKNAFDIMLDSSKLCWPSGDAPSHMPILQMVAENGWFPWNTDESCIQNPDYSNLRLVSKDMKNINIWTIQQVAVRISRLSYLFWI